MTVMIAALQVKIGDVLIREGDTLSLNGTTGEVLLGAMPTSKPEISGKLGKFMEFVQEVKTMEVRGRKLCLSMNVSRRSYVADSNFSHVR